MWNMSRMRTPGGWLDRIFSRRTESGESVTERDRTAGALAGTRLSWLLDAPLFIDEPLIERLFDAVVRPEYEVQGRIVGHVSEETRKSLTGVELGAQGGLKLPFL